MAPLIGLTGAPAAGKSTVAAILANAGCAVIDVDALGHDALDEPDVRETLVADLGSDVARADGTLDREAIAAVVFRDPPALRRLEAIVHPRVRARLVDAVDAARRSGHRAVVLDVALLFEGGLADVCDVTVTIDAPLDVREARAAERGWDGGELTRRESRQLSPAEKRSRADHVIVNDGDLERLRERTLSLLTTITPLNTITPQGDARAAGGHETIENNAGA